MADQPRMQTGNLLKIKEPIESEAAKEAAAALRAQLKMELQNLKQCTNSSYECTQLALDGYNFCLRHILQDKNAPYKQCTFIYNANGKRCHLPTSGEKKEAGYCNEHALKSHLTNSKRTNRFQPPHTAEVLLHSVSHYVNKSRLRTISSSSAHQDDSRSSLEENDTVTTKSYDPYVEIDANSIMASGSEILDMCSESESDVEPTTYGSVWHDAHAESSDDDSVDSEQEDILKHANVYSAEEITLIARDKLMRLRDLYIEQYTYLHHTLKERRRQYLHSLKREKETFSSIYNQIHDTPKEQRMYAKLKAYNSYHRKHGNEAICSKKLHERRVKVTEGLAPKTPSIIKCIYMEGGVKCGERALPTARHCRKHILDDANQILFRACGKMHSDIECMTPVETIFDDGVCRLHMDIPQIRSYSVIRKDSESDYDDSIELKTSLQEENLAMEYDKHSQDFDKNVLEPWRGFDNSIKMETEENLSNLSENVYDDEQHQFDLKIKMDVHEQETVPFSDEVKHELETKPKNEPESEMFIGFPSSTSYANIKNESFDTNISLAEGNDTKEDEEVVLQSNKSAAENLDSSENK